MHSNVKMDRTLVAVEVDQTVHMMLELTAPPAPTVERAPIDVVAVIDRSGSMSGRPLDAVLKAVRLLVRLLGPDDRIGVVTFDDVVDLVLPLEHHTGGHADTVLATLRAGGSTNLSGGWLKGLELLTALGRPEALKRVIVLTDGHANAGITDAAALCQLAGAANQQRITTTMVGFGSDYDESLLASMADAGGGNDYWCAGPDQAPQVFADEFAGLASVVAQNISVELRPTDVVEQCLVLNEYPITVVNGGMQMALGDAYGSERLRVVAMLRLRAPSAPGVVHVADAVIRWADTTGTVTLHTTVVPVTVGASADSDVDSAAPDLEVVEEINVLRVAKARKDAHEASERGDYAAASKHLSDVLPLVASARMDAAEIDEMRMDIERLSHGDWHQHDAKRQHSTMRASRKGRKTRYDDPS